MPAADPGTSVLRPRSVADSARGDPGLWLVPNTARRCDAVTGRATAGLVDQLTRGVMTTDSVLEWLTDIVEAGSYCRLRVVVGPAGSGKSTLLALLIRPGLVDTLDITADYVAAAVFLDATSTLESLTAELTGQLARRVPASQRRWRPSTRSSPTRTDARGPGPGTSTSWSRPAAGVPALDRDGPPGRTGGSTRPSNTG